MPDGREQERERSEDRRLADRVAALETRAAETSVTLKFVAETLKRLEISVCQIATDLNSWIKVQVNEAKAEREEHRMDVKVVRDELQVTFSERLAAAHADLDAKLVAMNTDFNAKLVAMDSAFTKRLETAIEGMRDRTTLWVAVGGTILLAVGLIIGFFIPR